MKTTLATLLLLACCLPAQDPTSKPAGKLTELQRLRTEHEILRHRIERAREVAKLRREIEAMRKELESIEKATKQLPPINVGYTNRKLAKLGRDRARLVDSLASDEALIRRAHDYLQYIRNTKHDFRNRHIAAKKRQISEAEKRMARNRKSVQDIDRQMAALRQMLAEDAKRRAKG